MAFPSDNPATRVLEIPELLHMIFGYSDDACNAANACVCKRWNSIALDTLWSEVDDLHRLFGLLGPLKQLGEDLDAPYAFVAAPDADDWRRFSKYSQRVRQLTFHADSNSRRLSPTVFEHIARTRTNLDILPNVTRLSWAAPLSLAVMFMHANIKRFVLWLPDKFAVPDLPLQPQYDLLPFFRDVASRMPHLTCLDIRTNMPMHDMETEMIFLLQKMEKLRKVVYPRFAITTRIIETLAQLQDLGTVEFQYLTEQGFGDPSDTQVFKPTLKMGAFPSLWDLSLTISLNDAVQFMRDPFAPANLTSLYFDSHLFETPAVVHELLSVLAETCQLLQSLGIITLVGAYSPSEERINFSALRPLLNFGTLETFEFIHELPLDLTLEDLDKLARSWPSLKKFIFNNEPAVSEHSSLTLKALIPFARHCPEIEQLGLFINASTADLPSYPTDLTSPYQSLPFGKLKRLSMGVSLIEDEGAVALSLSQLCPLGTHIEYGVTWETATTALPETLLDAMVGRCEKWQKVAELLPLLTRLRMEERERTRLLGIEVQDLRMRSEVLMDSAGKRGQDGCVVV